MGEAGGPDGPSEVETREGPPNEGCWVDSRVRKLGVCTRTSAVRCVCVLCVLPCLLCLFLYLDSVLRDLAAMTRWYAYRTVSDRRLLQLL